MTKEHTVYKIWFDEMADAAFVYKQSGKIVAVNNRACHILGYQEEEVLAKKMTDIDPGSVVSGIFGTGNHSSKIFWPHLSRRLLERKDGYSEPVEVRVNPLKKQKDTFIAIVRNVTKKISLESQLQQAQKMEAIGALAGGIAHEFNNILAAILGYGQIVRGQLPKDSPIRNDVDQILNGGIRATDLVKQILTLSRQEKEEFQSIYIQYLIKESLKLLRASLPATIDLKQDIYMKCFKIHADTSQVHQVVMNLCTNAKHAIGDKSGTMYVGLENVEVGNPEDILGIPLVKPGKYVVLTVRDTGSGMDEETQARAFEPFFSTKDKDTGTGLGLAIVHGIVKKHSGDITVISSPKSGTTFKVYFPAIDYKETTRTAKEMVAPAQKGDEKIMIVDDEAAVLITLKRRLEQYGYRITTFGSSLEAVSVFRENPDKFDIIITDMTMPEMTGFELAREMMSLRSDLPVLLMSGGGDGIDREKGKKIGIRGLLMKPFSHRELTGMVRKVLDNG